MKRLVIIIFNIKSITVQSSKCSHSVKFALCEIRSLCFISKHNLYIFKKTLEVTLLRETSEKLLFDIVHVTTFKFSNITLMVIPFSFKMVSGITYVLLAACLTA